MHIQSKITKHQRSKIILKDKTINCKMGSGGLNFVNKQHVVKEIREYISNMRRIRTRNKRTKGKY